MRANAFAPVARADYGAFYTPELTADFMVSLLELSPGQRILEPSAGEGSLVAALLRVGVEPRQITAWELDPDAVQTLRERFPGVQVECQDSLLDVGASSRTRFDRVIANPPYLSKSSAYIRAHRDALRSRFGASVGAGETFTMFYALGLDLLVEDGVLVYITADTIRGLATHERLRRRILTGHGLEVIARTPRDLFAGASVETVITKVSRRRRAQKVAILAEAPDERAYAYGPWSCLDLRDLARVDGAPFLLEAPPTVLALFDQPRRLGDLVEGRIGMHTRDNARSLAALEGTPMALRYERRRRARDEFRVISKAESENGTWRPYLKEGGDKDFWAPAHEFVDWSPERRAGYVIPASELYGRPGLCVSGISRRLSARVMPAGGIWDTNKVHGLVLRDPADTDLLLGLLCSDLYTYLAKRLLNASSSLQLSDLWKLPVPEIEREPIAAAAGECLRLTRAGADPVAARSRLDRAVYETLEISAADQRVIAHFTAGRRAGVTAAGAR